MKKNSLAFAALALPLVLAAPQPTEADPLSANPPSSEPDIVYFEPVDITALYGGSAAALTLPAAAFGSRADTDMNFFLGSGYVYYTGGASLFVRAPVSLPDGVEIQALQLYAYDNSSSTVHAYLMRQTFGNLDPAQYLASTSTIAEFPFVQVAVDNTVLSGTVDNDFYHYWVWVEIRAIAQRLYAVRLVYDDPVTAAPPETARPQVEGALGYPNPFSERTGVRFSLPRSERVEVGVFDVTGRLVQKLHSGSLDRGVHYVPWDGRGRTGRTVASGVYYVRVASRDRKLVTKLVRVD